jgi:hypothetical protein
MLFVFWLVNMMAKDHSENIGIDEKIIIVWILGK